MTTMETLAPKVSSHFEDFNFYLGIDLVMDCLRKTNAYIQVQSGKSLLNFIPKLRHTSQLLYLHFMFRKSTRIVINPKYLMNNKKTHIRDSIYNSYINNQYLVNDKSHSTCYPKYSWCIGLKRLFASIAEIKLRLPQIIVVLFVKSGCHERQTFVTRSDACLWLPEVARF